MGRQNSAIAAGSSHSLVATATGKVFSFGKGSEGQLGHGDKEHRLLPTEIVGLRGENVRAVAAGVQRSLVVADGGRTFGFGVVVRLTDDEASTRPVFLLYPSLVTVTVSHVRSCE